MKTFYIQYVLSFTVVVVISMTWTTTSHALVSKIFQSCINALTHQPLIETEQQMRDKGYNNDYIVGLDHARENVQLAEKLRSDSIDPKIDHIKEFSDLIDVHINYIEEGFRTHMHRIGHRLETIEYLDDKDSRLQQLELLKLEAQQRLMSKQVTYNWWFFFNVRLAIVITPWDEYMEAHFNTEELTEELMTHDGIEEFWKKNHSEYFSMMDQFPERILIPTIQDLGKIAINNTYGTGVHLIGVSNRFQTVHENSMSPFLFLDHDLEHAISRDIDRSRMARRVMWQIANLTGRQREIVEYLFFELSHEYGKELNKPDGIESVQHILINEPEGKRILIKIIRRSSSRMYHLVRFLP